MASSTSKLLNFYTLDDIIECLNLDESTVNFLTEYSQDPEEVSKIIINILDEKNILTDSSTVSAPDKEKDTTTESSEEKAFLSFFKKFDVKYGNDHITFQYCTLRQAIEYSCLAAKEYRKLLIIYLHDENSNLSQTICPAFVKGETRTILERSFDVLAWDMTSVTDSTLEVVIDEWPGLELIKERVKERCAGLFVLFPDAESVTVITKWDANCTEVNDVLLALKALEEITFVEGVEDLENVSNEQNQIGSKEFQQMMFDRLGDRDYDSFESNEHEHLKDKIGFSKFGPPTSVDGYDTKQKVIIDKTYKTIMAQCSKYSQWENYVVISFIYNCLEPLEEEKKKRQKKYPDYNEYTDIMPVPIYVIRKCYDSENSCRIFIDHSDRVYKSWSDYIEENKLHKCLMTIPRDGRYGTITNEGQVNLETYYSPACGLGRAILVGTDIASSVVGIGAGGVFILAAIPAITIAPIALGVAAVTGAGVGIYSIVRSSMTIHDRVTHEETMSFANSEARGTYLNIVAGSLGFVGMGATTVVSQLAARGVNIGMGAQLALNTVNVVNVGTGVANIANSTYDIVDNWIENNTVSPLSVLQLSSSILFFGNSIYNFRTASVIVNEAQANSIKNIQDSLSSNRQRNTFKKLYSETIRLNNGNVQKANADIISAIRNISNVNETFAILTRNNKSFSKAGVRFAINNGEITLNGVVVDILNFGSMKKSDTSQFLIDLPPAPKPSKVEVQKTNAEISKYLRSNIHLKNVKQVYIYIDILLKSKNIFDLFSELLNNCSDVIRQKILKIYSTLLENVDALKFPLVDMCKEYCKGASSNSDPLVVVLDLVLKFLKLEMNKHEETYRKKFGHLKHYDTCKNAVYFFDKVVNIFVNGGNVNVYLMDQLLKYVMSYISKEIFNIGQQAEKKIKRGLSAKKVVVCKQCNGKYFSI